MLILMAGRNGGEGVSLVQSGKVSIFRSYFNIYLLRVAVARSDMVTLLPLRTATQPE
jgi:hypothetical protein